MRKLLPIVFMLVIGFATVGIASQRSFTGMLSGSQEAPVVKTMARGEATFTLGADGKELMYKVTVSDIENVSAAHIHEGKLGKNGPALALIDIKGKKAGKFSGTLAEGKITSNELLGPLKGKSVSDLVKEIEAGDTYVNVHTDKHPDGELRAQIK